MPKERKRGEKEAKDILEKIGNILERIEKYLKVVKFIHII